MRHLSAVLLAATVFLSCEDRSHFVPPPDAGPVCGDNEKLVNGVCRFVCQRDGDCAAGEACNLLTGACGPKGPEVDAGPDITPCTTGAVRCAADSHSVQRCQEDGGWAIASQCPQPDGFCQNEQCLSCRPGLARCGATANLLQICKDDGSAFRDVTCTGSATCVAAECAECASGQKRCSPDNHSMQECRHQANEALSWTWFNAGDNFDGTCITQQCVAGGSGPQCVAPVCVPGAKQCLDANTQQTCTGTGGWDGGITCTSLPGMTATAQCLGGACIDECADAVRASSYYGCDYWSAVLDNSIDLLFKGGAVSGMGTADSDFVFVVTNQSVSPANVEVWRYVGSAPVRIKQISVPGRNDAATKGLVKIPVPWQSISPSTVDVATGNTGRARYGYHLTSNRPITVYQFSPVDAVKYTKSCTGTVGSQDCGCDEYSDNGSALACNHPGTCAQTTTGKKCSYGSFSNDASLLLPSHILGTSYVALTPGAAKEVATPLFGSAVTWEYSTQLVIVGTQDTTNVAIKLSAPILAGGTIPAMARGTTLNVTLNSYEVLQLSSGGPGADLECTSSTDPNTLTSYRLCRRDQDLTGSIVTADKPVAVFGGDPCLNNPYNRVACDHTEEQIFPFATWGKNFVAVPSAPLRLNSGTLPNTSAAPDHFKIVAGCPNTQVGSPCPNGTLITLSTAPAALNVLAPNNCLAGTSVTANNCRLPGGGFIEFKASAAFTISADQPIAVAQFFPGEGNLTGLSTDPSEGDPSMVLLPPIEQWRSRYTVLASTGLKDNYLSLSVDTAKVASVQVDGVVINLTPGALATDAKMVGSTTFLSKNHPVSTGTHTIQVNPKAGQVVLPGAGVTVYGYDAYVSYGYTGGLDLGSIVTGINPGG